MDSRAIWAAAGLEVRREGQRRTIRGAFPYGALAVMSDRGRVRKERFAPGAFKWALEQDDREVNLLAGHDFNRPLASRHAGTLDLSDTDDALTFRAEIDPELEEVSHVRDTLRMLSAGLLTDISPGFRVPPKETVPEAERLDPEPGNAGVFIRTLLAVVLYEISLVARPAYPASSAELRAMGMGHVVPVRRRVWLP